MRGPCLIRHLMLAALSAVLALGAAAVDVRPEAGTAPVFLVRIDGAIGPGVAAHVVRTIERAADEQAQLVVLQMDTPGGLDPAMRDIIKAILASPVPVASFVSPRGARAASAGTYILYASHLAAMAPATNLGAATPVVIGMPGFGPPPGSSEAPGSAASGARAAPSDPGSAKRINDAAAYIAGLARLRGRNADWAVRAVRESVSLGSDEALARDVIDLVAADLPDLLRRLDGRTLETAGGRTSRLSTADAPLVRVEPDWRGRLLGVVSDPSLVLILMMIGIYGLLFEFMSPGFVAPGVIGAVCLVLALWGMQMLPIDHAGLALMLLGVAFFVAEAFVPSYGVLGLGGIAAFAFGAVMLYDEAVPGFAIPTSLIAALTLGSAAIVIGIAGMAARARRRPVVSGAPHMIGTLGEVIESDVAGAGWVLVDGERWKVRSAGPLEPGQRVRIDRVDGLMLDVSPVGSPGGRNPPGVLR